MPNTENIIARILAVLECLGPIPLLMYSIGPPIKLPEESFSRYLTASMHSAYFVAIPRKAAKNIQKSAPGPPMLTAVATPAMFAVPTVAAMAVQSAAKLVTSPYLVGSPSWCVHAIFSDVDSFLICSTLSFNVRRSPSPRSRIIIGGPQMKL